ncbi:MAG: signal recognition particle protein, partial [Clostridia bacterium]|nr:signal recognition particle protein [Clostridia bacterium]
VILTKTDGDTRGGAALSVKAVTGTPIKLIGTGEKLDALEPFHPGRMASRILGMGDMLTLIEKAQQQVDEKKAHELEQKIRSNSFDFNDFLDNLRQLRSMGPIKSVIEMLPGIGSQLKDVDIDEKQFYRSESIITSMTGRERQKPELINPSRKRRIAAGSGTRVEDVNRLLKQFAEMQKMMKQMGSMKKSKRRPFMPFH